MKTTPTGRSTAAAAGEPSTTKKGVEAAEDHPNRPSSAVKGREPSPAATVARPVTPSRRSTSKPPSGKGRKGKKNPLAGPDEDDLPPPPPPPPPVNAAQMEASLVDKQAPAPNAEEDAAASEAATPPPAQVQSAEDDAAAESSIPPAAKRYIATTAILFLCTLLPLAAVVALVSLQAPLVDQRAARRSGAMDTSCIDLVGRLTLALQAEARAAEHLLVFHVRPTPTSRNTASSVAAANVSTQVYVAARSQYEDLIAATDAALSSLWTHWAVAGQSIVQQVSEEDVQLLRDAQPATAGSTIPWVALRGSAVSPSRRYDAGPAPSCSLNRAFDSSSLGAIRSAVFSATASYRTTPAYAALTRQLPSACSLLITVEFGPRLGDGSSIAGVAAAASTAAAGSVGMAASSQLLTVGTALLEASPRTLASWEAIGQRAAARTFPSPLPAAGIESVGMQSVAPGAVLAASSGDIAAQLAMLSPDAVDSVLLAQRQMLGAASALLDSISRSAASTQQDMWTPGALASAVTMWIALATMAISVVLFLLHALYESTNRDHYEVLDREMKAAEQALARMKQAASRVRCLKLSVVAALRRRARLARSEETAFYTALQNLRDVESYLPAVLTAPPKNTPPEALNSEGLNVRPHLNTMKGITAIRIDLSLHHRKFNDADSKKQAVHHHLVRFLGTVEESVHAIVPSGLVTLHGFYVMIWVDMNADVAHPCSSAVNIALDISDKSMEIFNIAPCIVISHADIVAGNVGSLTDQPDENAMQLLRTGLERNAAPSAVAVPTPSATTAVTTVAAAPAAASELPQHRSFKAFTTFGPLNEDADMLVAASRLHTAQIVCTQTVARHVYAELKDAENAAAGAAMSGGKREDFTATLELRTKIQFRGLELVANAAEDGSAIAHELGSTAGASTNVANTNTNQMGTRIDHKVHNARLVFEVTRRPKAGKDLHRVDEWNKALRAYCSGQSRQANTVLKRWVEVFGETPSVTRLNRLITVAERLYGVGEFNRPSQPFVSSYTEIMRDALVQVA